MGKLPHTAKISDLLRWVAANPNKPFDPPVVVTLSTGHADDWEFRAVTAQMEDLRRQGYVLKLKQDPWGSTFWTITDSGTKYLRALESTGGTIEEDIGERQTPNEVVVTPKMVDAPLLSVFLCHSSADKAVVRKLYKRLKAEGFLPWLDEEDLIAGQDWEYEIRKAVRRSDVVLVCLSPNSANKTGFIQKEIKYALDVADEQPEGSIFIVPLKLEQSEVPSRLAKWHWINYFDAEGHTRLIRALRARSSTTKGPYPSGPGLDAPSGGTISDGPPDSAPSQLAQHIGSTSATRHEENDPRVDPPGLDKLDSYPFLAVINQSIKAVPQVRWALGVVGIVSAVGFIIAGLKVDPIVAIVGFIFMIISMAILLIFAHAARNISGTGTLLAKVFIWFILVSFMASVITAFASAITDKPLPLRSWFMKQISPHARTVIDFSSVDTNMPPKYVPADAYLNKFGITISDVTDPSKVVLQHDFTNGESAFSSPSHNALTQIDCKGKPVGFTLQFNKPVSRIWFQRASLIAGVPNGITHPAWRACALNQGVQLDCRGEQLLREFFNISDHEFVLEDPEITSVRFDSDLQLDGKPFAAFCGVVIQRITIER